MRLQKSSFECFCQQSTSETEQNKMEPVNQFVNLTWDDLTIIDDELKAVKDINVKSLKYRDLRMICTQLKIRG